MNLRELLEGVGRITHQNKTPDVDYDEIEQQAKKFGNNVDKDGYPPTLSSDASNTNPNKAFNLGLTESKDQKCPRTKSPKCQCEQVKQIDEDSDEEFIAMSELEESDTVTGQVFFMQKPGTSTLVKGKIQGLKPGLHGFHIHKYSDFSEGCDSTGGHFNPENVNHGDLNEGHAGDFGNIEANKDGVAKFLFEAKKAELTGEDSIVGRSIVVHEGEDDLGKGNDKESLESGNSGDRVACGVIMLINPDK